MASAKQRFTEWMREDTATYLADDDIMDDVNELSESSLTVSRQDLIAAAQMVMTDKAAKGLYKPQKIERNSEINASLFFLTGKVKDGEFVFQSTRSREEHEAIVKQMESAGYSRKFPDIPIKGDCELDEFEHHRMMQLVWKVINDQNENKMPQKHVV